MAQVAGRQTQHRCAVVVGRGGVGKAGQRAVDVRQRAAEHHRAVCRADAGGECQPGGSRQRQRAVGDRQDHVQLASTSVRVSDHYLIAIASTEHQRGVLRGHLRPRHGIDGRVIHWRHRNGNDHGVAVRCAVIGFVGEAVGGGFTPVVGIAESAVGVQRQGAMGRACHQYCRERLVFRIGVIGQQAAGSTSQCRGCAAL